MSLQDSSPVASGAAVREPVVIEGARQNAIAWLPFIVLGALWLWLINNLRLEWSVNDQYSYGFAVPLLALYLFWQRWKSAPEVAETPAPRLILTAAAAAAFFLLPLQLFAEANPEWRFVSWCMAVVVVGISVTLLLHRAGLPWTLHFLFPICFIFTAVPWPTGFEGRLTENLMQLDATVAVEFLKWLGIPALRHGNVINVAGGVVGVDEACSGIRSLQNTLMISLFLGELYRFSFFRRAILVASAAAVAFFCNLGRTFFLAWLSAGRGTVVMEKWHDTAGIVVLGATLGALLAITYLLRRGSVPSSEIESDRSAFGSFHPWPTGVLAGLGIWLLIVTLGTEAWYRFHERNIARAPTWSVQWPTASPGFRDENIPATSRALLKYTDGRRASWTREDGLGFSAFFLQWAPGRTARIAARWHHPDVCLSAVGHRLQSDNGIRLYQVHGIAIPFHGYVFGESGRQMHVWQCIWDDETSTVSGWTAADATSQISNRIKAVAHGRRNLGQQVLEVAIWGAPRDAEAAFQQTLETIVRR